MTMVVYDADDGGSDGGSDGSDVIAEDDGDRDDKMLLTMVIVMEM